MRTGIEHFNNLAPEEAHAALIKCCGAKRWAYRVASRRPFADELELAKASDSVWWSLDTEDWLEAFSHHPKIGERKAAATVASEAQRWSEEEQASTNEAPTDTMDALAAGNRLYEQKFGYIYIVCATGKSPAEMLELLNRRLSNDPTTELRVAAEEQRRITNLRLHKLLEQ